DAVARYTAQRELRRSFRDGRGSVADVPAPATHVAEMVLVGQALSRLSEGCRGLLTRYFIEGRSYEEIAAELKVPLGTVKSRLFRCLAAASQSLQRQRPSPWRPSPAAKEPRGCGRQELERDGRAR